MCADTRSHTTLDALPSYPDRSGLQEWNMTIRNQIRRALPSQQLRDFCQEHFSATARARDLLETPATRLARAAGESPLGDPSHASLQGRLSDWVHSDLFRAQTLASTASGAVIERQRMADQLREYQTPQTIADLFSGMRTATLRVSDAVAVAREWLMPFHDLLEHLRQWPQRAERCLLAMARAGWYPDEDLLESRLLEVEEILDKGGQEALDACMVDYLRGALDGVEEAVVSAHPQRARFLRRAFAAHRNGDYALSIPALLAQIDGICADITHQQLFSGNGAGRYSQGLDIGAIERAYLTPLHQQSGTPLFHSAREREQATGKFLNRHAVLHGESLDYDSEEMGLRAISLLAFVSAVLLRAQEAKAA